MGEEKAVQDIKDWLIEELIDEKRPLTFDNLLYLLKQEAIPRIKAVKEIEKA